MKYILFAIFTIFIISLPVFTQEVCNINTAKNALSPVISYEQTIDGNTQNVLITRFLHNKIGIFMSHISKCYLEFFNPVNLYLSVGIYGLIFYLFLIYKILTKNMVLLMIAVFTAPILLILMDLAYLTSIFYKSASILGLAIYFRNK